MKPPSKGEGKPCRDVGAHSSQQADRMKECVRVLLKGLGEDPSREGLVDTPQRVVKALLEVSRGHRTVHSSALGDALFHEPIVSEGGQGIVLVRDIEFASTSEASLLPFHGRCHIAYVPSQGTVIGLSKLARLTKLLAKRLLTQEQLGQDISVALQQHMACQGVAVVIAATHLALASPTAPQQHVTACVNGCFAAESSPQLQLLMSMLDLPDLPASRVTTCPPVVPLPSSCMLANNSNKAPPSRSTASSCADSVAVDSSDKDCELSEKDESCDGEERLSTMSTEDGERLGGGCMDWDGEHTEAAALATTTGTAAVSSDCAGAGDAVQRAVSVPAMEAAVHSLLVEMGECPTRAGLQGSARRYVATLLASTSGYHSTLPSQTLPPPTQQQQQQQQQQYPHDSDSPSLTPWSPWQQRHHTQQQTLQHQQQQSQQQHSQQHPHHSHQQHSQQQQQQQERTHSGCSCCSDQSQRSLGGSSSVEGVRHSVGPSTQERVKNGSEVRGRGASCHSQQAQQQQQQQQLCAVSVPFNSQCEHHMLPFYGTANVVFLSPSASSAQAADSVGEASEADASERSLQGNGVSVHAPVSASGSAGQVGPLHSTHDAIVDVRSADRGAGVSESCGGAGVSGARTCQSASVREQRVIESIVGVYTQRLQVQERITHQVADAVAAELGASAVVVMVDAAHMCMMARGVENHAGRTTTVACRGSAVSDSVLCHQALLACKQQQSRQSRR